jgi:hypothetical protein
MPLSRGNTLRPCSPVPAHADYVQPVGGHAVVTEPVQVQSLWSRCPHPSFAECAHFTVTAAYEGFRDELAAAFDAGAAPEDACPCRASTSW